MSIIEGRTWKFGDNIDTEVIVPGKYLIGDIDEIAAHVMEGVRPGFADLVGEGEIVVGGKNFGTGSSREVAPRALQAAGVAAVVAESFPRIFFRNCVNVGLIPVECSTVGSIAEGDTVRIDTETGEVTVVGTGAVHSAIALPAEIAEILAVGGLERFLKQNIGDSA